MLDFMRSKIDKKINKKHIFLIYYEDAMAYGLICLNSKKIIKSCDRVFRT